MPWLIVPVMACFAPFYFGIIRKWGHLSPIALFSFLQMLMALGSFILIDPTRLSERLYGYLLLYCMLVFMGVSALVLSANNRRVVAAQRKPYTSPLGWAFWGALFISIFVVVGYFTAIGYSAFIVGIRAAFAGEGVNIAQIRVASYGGSKYFFPGYVNQFKNILLPALVVIMITRWADKGLLRARIVPVAVFSAIALLGLIGTGQRGAFIIFMAIVVAYIARMDRYHSRSRIVLLGMFAAGVVILSTIALGRQDVASASGLSSKISTAVPQFISRVLTGNAGSAVTGFAYIYENKVVQNGQDWLQAFLGVLPGDQFRGSTIENEIFAYRFGSMAGNSPPSLWGSIYYNFGWIGITIAPWIIAVLICTVTIATKSFHPRSSVQALGISGVSAVTGFWVAGSPMFLLNNGILVYLLLWAIGSRLDSEGEKTKVSNSDLLQDGSYRVGPAVPTLRRSVDEEHRRGAYSA